MTIMELVAMMKSLDVPTSYLYFKDAPKSDCVVYSYDKSCFGSDESNELFDVNVRIELYTEYKNEELENQVTSLLDEKGIDYEIDGSSYIESEKRLMTVITFSFLMLKED